MKNLLAVWPFLFFIDCLAPPASEIFGKIWQASDVIFNLVSSGFQNCSSFINFQFFQAILKSCNSLGLANLIDQDEEAATFVKELMSIIFVPAEDMVAAFDELVGRLRPALRARMRTLINKVRRFWFLIITPEGMTLFGLINRTNNICETWHARIYRILRTPNPMPYEVFGNFCIN